MNDKPKLSIEVLATLQVVRDPHEGGSVVRVSCRGPGEKPKTEGGQWPAMWVDVLASNKSDAFGALVRASKGDIIWVKGNLRQGAEWVTREGETRAGRLVLWADSAEIAWSENPPAAPVDQPIGDESDIPF